MKDLKHQSQWFPEPVRAARPDDMERSIGLVLGLESVADIAARMATLGSTLGNA